MNEIEMCTSEVSIIEKLSQTFATLGYVDQEAGYLKRVIYAYVHNKEEFQEKLTAAIDVHQQEVPGIHEAKANILYDSTQYSPVNEVIEVDNGSEAASSLGDNATKAKSSTADSVIDGGSTTGKRRGEAKDVGLILKTLPTPTNLFDDHTLNQYQMKLDIRMEHLKDLRMKGAVQMILETMCLLETVDCDNAHKYVCALVDMIAIGIAGIIKIASDKTSRLCVFESPKGQYLRSGVPEWIRKRIRERTNVVYTPGQNPATNSLAAQGQIIMSVWYNFYIGCIMAVARKRDEDFDLKSLANLCTIPPDVVGGIRCGIRTLKNTHSRDGRLTIRRDIGSGDFETWNKLLPILDYPATNIEEANIGLVKKRKEIPVQISVAKKPRENPDDDSENIDV
jgi:hypothetical protein